MTFSTGKFVKTLVLTLLVGLLAVGALKSFGFLGGRKGPSGSSEPAVLAQEAKDALEAVKLRKPGDRRPASYDSVLRPLDTLLKQAGDLIAGESFNPVTDYEKVRALTTPVIEIATQADSQARNETGFITKEYRFNAQKAEAIRYQASTLWERITMQLPPDSGFFSEGGRPYPQADMNELTRLLDLGIRSDPENADLWYVRGVVNRAQGLFAPAARDLARAVAIDNELPGAWNTLGLVYINLKEFDKAEDALERARALTLKQAEELELSDPGPEYTAILYNLAMFHEGLSAHYLRENRITPTVEYERMASRHSAEARRYFQEFLAREPSDTPDARTARAKMQGLP